MLGDKEAWPFDEALSCEVPIGPAIFVTTCHAVSACEPLLATVDPDHLACDVARVLGDKEGDRAGDLDRPAVALP